MSEPDVKLTGIWKHFNSYTIRGRANRFYAGCFGAFLVYRYWKSSVRKNHERISEHSIAEYYEKKAKQREKMMENASVVLVWGTIFLGAWWGIRKNKKKKQAILDERHNARKELYDRERQAPQS